MGAGKDTGHSREQDIGDTRTERESRERHGSGICGSVNQPCFLPVRRPPSWEMDPTPTSAQFPSGSRGLIGPHRGQLTSNLSKAKVKISFPWSRTQCRCPGPVSGRVACFPPTPKGLCCCAWDCGLLCVVVPLAPCCLALQDQRDPLSGVCHHGPPRKPAPCWRQIPRESLTLSLLSLPADPQHWRQSASRERRRWTPSRRRSGAWRQNWKPCRERPMTPQASWSSSARSCSGRSGESAAGGVVDPPCPNLDPTPLDISPSFPEAGQGWGMSDRRLASPMIAVLLSDEASGSFSTQISEQRL